MQRDLEAPENESRVLTCGHSIPEGAEAASGRSYFCAGCHALLMPSHFVAYKSTPVFNASTVPAGLLRDHSTKRGVWGKIVVLSGRLRYHVPRLDRNWDLAPGVEGIIAPEDIHSVELVDDTIEFQVQFFRAPD